MGVRCKDPGVYKLIPRWSALGFESPDQLRLEALSRPSVEWEEAVSLHVQSCSFCASTAGSLASLEKAIKASAKPASVYFAMCPTPEALALFHWKADIPEEQRRAIEDHLNKCSACQAEERWLALTEDATPAKMFSKRWYFPAAAALLVASIVFTQYFKTRVPRPPTYADLASMPATLNEVDLLASSVPADRPLLQNTIADYNAKRYPRAEQRSRELIATGDNPSAEFVMAMSMFRRGNPNQAYAAMQESERTAPLSEYRCWTLLQMALLKGDRKVVERECNHVRNNASYGPKAKAILKAVAERQSS
jgi:hypothetical protein